MHDREVQFWSPYRLDELESLLTAFSATGSSDGHSLWLGLIPHQSSRVAKGFGAIWWMQKFEDGLVPILAPGP